MSRSLSRLLFPRSIAFVGGRECDVAIRKTLALGFEGRIFPVNPRRTKVGGLETFPTVADLPEAPDTAFIAVKREPTVEIVRELRRCGAGGAVVFASGFAETGDRYLQDELLAAADGLPIMGPNCNGYVNFMGRAVLWADDHGGGPCDHGVAVAAQSGNIAVNLTMLRRGMPLAGVFALGNQADVDLAQMVEALAEDDRVSAIGLHVEGLRDVAAFSRAAAVARARRKPIVALKTGRSPEGAAITMSHTSSLAGEDTLYDALFERCGIARVGSITAFAETLKFLHYGGPARGCRLVSMSCSGGEAALAADMAEGHGVSFPSFDPDASLKLASTLNELVSVHNPLDYQTFAWGDRDKLEATFAAALAADFDIGMLILDVPTVPGVDPTSWITTAEAFARAAASTGTRAAIVASLPECLPEDMARRMGEAGIAPMAGLGDALGAFEAAAAIGRNWSGAEPLPLVGLSSKNGDVRPMTEHAAKQLLSAAGLAVPEGMVGPPSGAADAARRLGFPVAVKASSAALAHKTEAGGVALGLRSAEQVAEAADRMASIAAEVLVERMVVGAVCELIVGVRSDPQFGLALVIGAGGILTELVKDTATLILPATRQEIERALGRLTVSKLIDGFRGRSGDRQAVIAAIQTTAAFAQAHADRLAELEINPLLVLPQGAGVVAADALIRMHAE